MYPLAGLLLDFLPTGANPAHQSRFLATKKVRFTPRKNQSHMLGVLWYDWLKYGIADNGAISLWYKPCHEVTLIFSMVRALWVGFAPVDKKSSDKFNRSPVKESTFMYYTIITWPLLNLRKHAYILFSSWVFRFLPFVKLSYCQLKVNHYNRIHL